MSGHVTTLHQITRGLLVAGLVSLFHAIQLQPAWAQHHATPNRSITMTAVKTAPAAAGPSNSTDETAIRPFHYRATDAELAELRRRVLATRFPEKETVDDFTQGPQLATIERLAKYWGTEYDWRRVEARLNALPQFVTRIDGLDIHFIHVRSKHPNALPVIVTHGWPGSVIEQLKIIDPLVNPTAHGGAATDAFDVVIPSMPGYGFSERPATTGWGPERIARAWIALMERLGYTRYVAQGGDWGAAITEIMATMAPKALIGIHVNMPSSVQPDLDKLAFANAPAPEGLTAEEKGSYQQLAFFYTRIAYATMMGSRPQSLAGIADSPVGIAAYFLDHDKDSYDLITRVFNGEQEGLTRDDVLDNVTLTWLTNTFVSGARLYWEYKGAFFAVRGVKIPVVVSAFPNELFFTPKSWAERAFPKLLYYKSHPKGGHFAAFEQPAALTSDMREGFRALR
jgi:pimeloyl-ACP methyl ester carboxylesterase